MRKRRTDATGGLAGRDALMRQVNRLAREVVDAAVAVHRALGPGLLERVYKNALLHELALRRIAADTEVPIHGTYKGRDLGCVYRCDLLVEDCLLVELKALETLDRVHRRQTLTYLRLSGLALALLLNFGAPLMRDGIVRLANTSP